MSIANDDVVIRFSEVAYSYGRKTPMKDMRKQVLHGLNLELLRGQAVCLLGPSGCGKTTMVNLVMGNLVPTEGVVEVMGEQAPYPHARQRIGFMPQDEALYADITAMDNLYFFGQMYGMSRREIDERASELLRFVRLEDDAKKLVSSYSGGMKRRLSLAVALLHDPDLLVLDEPTVGLDPEHRRRIWSYFDTLMLEGKTILVTTHVMDEAERCSSIAMLQKGRVAAFGSPEEILAQTGAKNIEDAFLVLQGALSDGGQLVEEGQLTADDLIPADGPLPADVSQTVDGSLPTDVRLPDGGQLVEEGREA